MGTHLHAEDYPALYRAADRRSGDAQARYLQAVRTRLTLLLLAAAAGLGSLHVNALDVLGIVGAVAFVVALLVDVHLRTNRPDRTWYDGRAAAESVKTLTWRYVSGGRPFPCSLPAHEADNLFTTRLGEIMETLPGLHLVPETEDGAQITARMRRLRLLGLDERRALYQAGRIGDQRNWYGVQARTNEVAYRKWSTRLLMLEVGGALGAVLRVAGLLDIAVLGFASAAVAAATAWVETRQHQTMAKAYTVAHHELGLIAARSHQPMDEDRWTRFVDESEEAISREHTLWRASHSA